MEPEHDENEKRDQDYKPHGIPSRQAIKPPHEKYSRRSKRYGPGDASDADNAVILYNFFCSFGYMSNITVDFQLNKAQNGSGQAD
jgi:histone demethylase JARID1